MPYYGELYGDTYAGFNGASVMYVCISIHSDWGSLYLDQGLAEVRFCIGGPMEEICIPGGLLADLNEDCIVNLADFAILANEWLEEKLQP